MPGGASASQAHGPRYSAPSRLTRIEVLRGRVVVDESDQPPPGRHGGAVDRPDDAVHLPAVPAAADHDEIRGHARRPAGSLAGEPENSGAVAWPGARTPRRLSTTRTRLGQDAGVQAGAAVPHVPDVQRELDLPGQGVAPAHLGEPGDPRPHLVPAGLFGCVPGEVAHQQRPGADQAHLTAQHVPQRRQLVQARRPQPAAEAGEPVGVADQTRAHVDLPHRAELDHPERHAGAAGPGLPQQHRPAQVDQQQRPPPRAGPARSTSRPVAAPSDVRSPA